MTGPGLEVEMLEHDVGEHSVKVARLLAFDALGSVVVFHQFFLTQAEVSPPSAPAVFKSLLIELLEIADEGGVRRSLVRT